MVVSENKYAINASVVPIDGNVHGSSRRFQIHNILTLTGEVTIKLPLSSVTLHCLAIQGQ